MTRGMTAIERATFFVLGTVQGVGFRWWTRSRALELGLAIKKKYNVRLDAESAETKKHFYSVQSLAAMIASVQTAGSVN